MYKMIIADDELIVRRGLKNIIKWEDFGIEVIAEASDGEETFELCQQLNPDILFTDIRMPFMDGLEVAMKLKESGSNIRVIIFSGIQDFNYAKTALDINVEGYVLKPIKDEELKEVVTKVVNRIKLERNRQSEMALLKQQLKENFSVIRDKFLRNLILGINANEIEIKEKMQFFKIPFKADESLLISVLQIDDYMKVTENSTEEDKQLLSFSISNIIDEILTNYNAGIVFCKDENEFILILNQNVQANGKYSEVLEEISLCINKHLGITVSIGVGCPVSRILSANSSYKDAFTALQYRFYTGKNSILYISDIRSMSDVPLEGIDTTRINEYESQIMNSIKLGNIESVAKTLVNMFNFLFQYKNLPVYYIQSVCLELVFMTSRTILDLGETLDSIVNNNSVIIESIYKIENGNELKNYISTLLIKAAKHFSLKYSQKNSKIIGRIKEIIENNYKDDISVKKISEDVYLTPNYLSLIFKQETGETITEYITKIRMEHAKKLLKSTDLRIKEVAEMVGYDDPHYFSKVFKKYTGIYPQKFKA